ncbi:MAG: YwiC-like family protein [Anaerolineales bacterium]
MRNFFKKQIAIPQDHGSWVFILSPLFVGIFAGTKFTPNTLFLSLAVMSAFMLRQPVVALVKSYSGRRPKTDLPAAIFWSLIYGSISALALIEIILYGFVFILYLIPPVVPIFLWHLWLVSQRNERKQAGVEIIATGVLSLAAPAAYWIGIGSYHPTGWWLWLLTWLQSAASIVYAYLRLEQRDQLPDTSRSEQWKSGQRALLYTSFNLLTSLILGWYKLIPPLIFAPFLIQWLETLWGITHPAIKWKPMRIGMRQFLVSSLWTILFIIFWRTT